MRKKVKLKDSFISSMERVYGEDRFSHCKDNNYEFEVEQKYGKIYNVVGSTEWYWQHELEFITNKGESND